MAPSRILLTGAGGFVGRHLSAQLRQAFPAAVIVGTALEPAAGLRALDVTDAAAVQALVRAVRPDACVHLAAIAAIPASGQDPALAWKVNLHGTLGVAHAILAHAPDCRLVWASSAEVYGRSFRSGTAIDESAVLAPTNTYAATKAAADLALGALAASEGLRAVRVRPFNHTGPGQAASFVVPAFARQIARIEAGLQPPLLRVGALDPLRDFLDVHDVCAAYVACLQAPALEPGLVLNIASGTPRRIGDILDALLALAEVKASVETGGALIRRSEILSATGNASAARALLGWSPNTPWEATLRSVLDDWRQRVPAEPAD